MTGKARTEERAIEIYRQRNGYSDPKDVPDVHGRPGGYVRGCRCAPCTEAHRLKGIRDRAKRRAKLKTNPDLVTHGTLTTYTQWGCRCPECKAAQAKASKAYRAKRKREGRPVSRGGDRNLIYALKDSEVN